MGTGKIQVWSAKPFQANVQSSSENEWRRILFDVRFHCQFIVSRTRDAIHPILESVKKRATKQAVKIETGATRMEVWNWRPNVSCRRRSPLHSEDECFFIQAVRAFSSCFSKSSLGCGPHKEFESFSTANLHAKALHVFLSTCSSFPLR